MVDLNSSPSNEKPNLDVLFPDLKKADTALPAPRFLAPAAATATLLKGAPPSARLVPPPSGRLVPPPPSVRKPASVKPPPPSARLAAKPQVEEIEAEELLASSPGASAAALEPIRPVDDDYVDEGPTVALHSSPLFGAPITARPLASAPRPSSPLPPSSHRAAPPVSATKLPPLPSAPSSGKHSAPVAAKPPSTPGASKLPPVPMPPPSLKNLAPPSMPKASPPPLPQVAPVGEAETLAPPPVSSKAARASAAANLVAASGPARHYVPPSVPPPVSRPFSAQETIPASRAHSLMPTAASVPPPALFAAPPKKSRAGFVALAAVASLGVFGVLGFAATKGGAALGLGSSGTGAVAITAAGPSGAKVDGLRVFVDGVVKCDGAPCRLADLSTGTHFVSADAPGFAATAARAISVERGAEATLHIDLVPTAAAPAEAKVEAKPEAKATSLDELKPQESAQRAQASEPQPRSVEKNQKADKKDSKKDDAAKTAAKDDTAKASSAEAVGNGTLNINSIPVASVVLDGRPVGSTPLIGLKVSPGPHSVVFIHPEHGRKASGTTVKAGGSATVAVRF